MPRKPSQRRGVFITFEGTEGVGKSTLMREVAQAVQASGRAVTLTREPGGNPTAEKIRELILQNPMSAWTEVFLYEASRAEHVCETIRPALEAGHVVLCDRFDDSTLAYQSAGRGLPWGTLKTLNRLATGGLKPHLTVWLDADPATGLKNAKNPNRFEAEGVKLQTRVRTGFARLYRTEKKRFLKLQALRESPQILGQKVMERVWKLL